MTQNASDVEIANQGFAAFRQDLNDVLEDITTLHSGTAAPSTTYANQWWYETDTDKLYIRNEDNDAWIEILTLDQANDHLASLGASITLDGTGNVSIDSGDFTVDTDTLHVDSTNNRVGAGTASPTGVLEVKAGSNLNAVFDQLSMDNASDEGIGIEFSRTTSETKLSAIGTIDTDKLAIASRSGLHFYTGGLSTYSATEERMRIDSSGNVGIGTTSPTAPLMVNAGATNFGIVVNSTDQYAGIAFADNTTTTNAHVTVYADGNNLGFEAGNAERMRIDSAGNVLVGRTSGSSTTEDAGLVFSDFGYIYSARDGTSNQTHHLFINNAAVSATAVGSIKTSGSTTSYNTTSDYRLKENVTDLTGAITRVKNLSPKRFNFTGFTDTVDGFLAHEAQTVVPEAVHGTHNETEAIGDITDADSNTVETGVVEPDTLEDGHTWTETGTQPVYQGIDQAKLVPLLTAALQEAITKIEDLETRVAALEAE